MNITRDFVQFMQDEGYGTFGTDLYIGTIPEDAPNVAWWVISGGGSSSFNNTTGERQKEYIINVFYRDMDAEVVYNKLQEFEELINSNQCTQLENFDTIEMEATLFPTDEDIDLEERTIGTIQVTLTTYK